MWSDPTCETQANAQRDGAARPAPGNGNKRQRPNPRPDLKRGREADEREMNNRGTGPSHTELNNRKKTRLEALSRRYPVNWSYVRSKGPRL